MARLIKVLSIDGGGIRGIIPALILQEIERRTNKRISSLFDLIAGTSAGGILALALTMPGDKGQPRYSAEEIIPIYEDKMKRIFSRTVWHKIQAVGNLAEVKYPTEGIESVLQEFFGDLRLKDAVADILVTSFEIEQQRPFIFKSHKARKDPQYDFLMHQVARATSAAPTYFEPCKVEVNDILGYRALVDGLVFASNPAMCAYIEVKKMYPKADKFLIVSLGTGEPQQRRIYDEIRRWGALQWLQPLIDIILYGSSVTVDYQLKNLLKPKDNFRSYYRFQCKLDLSQAEMDNIDAANLRTLKLTAEDMLRKEKEKLDLLCEQLLK
ncbi:MAG: patatin-like phospholipase family protein [candidate division Zixibacteria bacterium]|nr:patatin-like phospholipase family protein [candidate division Zixibacteria bacterium]MDD5425092.1 patatin-like phospholipase family protein [candidate division Zixibacteria bacterium]